MSAEAAMAAKDDCSVDGSTIFDIENISKEEQAYLNVGQEINEDYKKTEQLKRLIIYGFYKNIEISKQRVITHFGKQNVDHLININYTEEQNYNKILIELYNFILFKYPLKWPIPNLARKAGIKDINISFVHLIFFLHLLSIDNSSEISESKHETLDDEKPKLMRDISNKQINYKEPTYEQKKTTWGYIKSLYCQTMKIGKYSAAAAEEKAAAAAEKAAEEKAALEAEEFLKAFNLHHEIPTFCSSPIYIGGAALDEYSELISIMTSKNSEIDIEKLYNDFKVNEYDKIKSIMLNDIKFGETNLPCNYGVKQLFFGKNNIIITYHTHVGYGGVIKNKRKRRISKKKGRRKSKKKGRRKYKKKGQRKSKKKGRRHRRRTKK